MQLQIRHWLRVVLWLTPVVVLSVWVGASALPTLALEARIGALCSAGTAALRTGAALAPLARKARFTPGAPVQAAPGVPPVPDPKNLYSETAAGELNQEVAGDFQRIYVPNRRSNNVYAIDPQSLAVLDRFPVGVSPQHVVPSWDLRTLWVANNGDRRPNCGVAGKV